MMTRAQIDRFLREQGVEPFQFICLDSEYSLPDADWINGDFSTALAASGFALLYGDYIPEACDCDDFAFFAHFMAKVANARAKNKRGILFGVLTYERDKGGGHAINWFISVKNGERQLHFWEPQTKSEIKLSKHEKGRIDSVIV